MLSNMSKLLFFQNYLMGGRHGRDHMVVEFSAYHHITTEVVSSNPTQVRCARYNIMW